MIWTSKRHSREEHILCRNSTFYILNFQFSCYTPVPTVGFAAFESFPTARRSFRNSRRSGQAGFSRATGTLSKSSAAETARRPSGANSHAKTAASA